MKGNDQRNAYRCTSLFSLLPPKEFCPQKEFSAREWPTLDSIFCGRTGRPLRGKEEAPFKETGWNGMGTAAALHARPRRISNSMTHHDAHDAEEPTQHTSYRKTALARPKERGQHYEGTLRVVCSTDKKAVVWTSKGRLPKDFCDHHQPLRRRRHRYEREFYRQKTQGCAETAATLVTGFWTHGPLTRHSECDDKGI
jgi:hypothetical protein